MVIAISAFVSDPMGTAIQHVRKVVNIPIDVRFGYGIYFRAATRYTLYL